MNINFEIFGQSIIAALDADLIDLDDAEELVDACYVAASNLCESSNVDVTSISLSEGTSRYRSDISKEMKIDAPENKNIGLEQKKSMSHKHILNVVGFWEIFSCLLSIR